VGNFHSSRSLCVSCVSCAASVCTISPTTGCFEESHNTLKFADRAKAITNRAKLNEVRPFPLFMTISTPGACGGSPMVAVTVVRGMSQVLDDKALIKIYRDKISQLKRRLQEVREKEEQIQKLQTAELEKKSLEESNVILLERYTHRLVRSQSHHGRCTHVCGVCGVRCVRRAVCGVCLGCESKSRSR